MGEGPDRSEAYFSSPELTQRADLLRHLTENSDLIPLIRGAEGIGKSTFISHLLGLAPENWIPVQIVADVMLQPEALLANLARMYDLNATGGELMERLASRFDDLRQDGYLPVIIIDDAHLLPEASIIALLRLHEIRPNDNPLAQILFFAQPEIDNLLNTPLLKVMNLQSLQLLDMPLFTQEQTQRFLEHLLAAESPMSTPPLSPAQVEKVFRDTGGMPGRIKQQAAGLLGVDTKMKPVFDITEYLSKKVIIGGGIALIMVFMGLIYQDSINRLFSGESEMSDVNQDPVLDAGRRLELALPGSGPDIMEQPESTGLGQVAPADAVAIPELADVPEPEPVAPKELQSEAAPSSSELDKMVADAQEESVAVEPVLEPEPITAPPVAEVKPPSVKMESKPKTPVAEPVKPPVSRKPRVVVDAEPNMPKPVKPAVPAKAKKKPVETRLKKTLVLNKPQAKPAAVPALVKPKPPVRSASTIPIAERSSGLARVRPAPVEDRSTLLVKKDVPAVKLTQMPAAKPSKAPMRKASVQKAQRSGLRRPLREDWLLKQRASSYTIQLVGLQDEKSIAMFLRRHPVPDPVAYYRTKRNNKPWFPVLYGVYPDKKMAAQARDNLPEKLRKSGVWLRNFASVHKEIRVR